MTRYFILLLLSLTSYTKIAIAQHARIAAVTTFKGNLIDERLKATNSIRYTYSAGRTGWEDPASDIKFFQSDEQFDYHVYESDTLENTRQFFQSFDTNNNRTSYVIIYKNLETLNFDSSSYRHYEFSKNDLKTEVFGCSFWYGKTRHPDQYLEYKYKYNKEIYTLFKGWYKPTSSFEPSLSTYKTYDRSGRLLIDSNQSVDGRTYYDKYNYAINKVTVATFDKSKDSKSPYLSDQYIWAFDARYLITSFVKSFSGYVYKEDLVYRNKKIEYKDVTSSSEGYPPDRRRIRYLYDADDNVGGKIETKDNDTVTKLIYLYDHTHNILQSDEYNYRDKEHIRKLYYYENILPLSAEENIDGDLRLYIEDFWHTSILHIRLKFNSPQKFTASIKDMQGHVLCKWKETATQYYNQSICTVGLGPGSYVLCINGQRSISTRFVIEQNR